MKRLAGFRKKVIEGWTVQRIAAVLIVVGVVVFVAGIVNQACTCMAWPNLGETANRIIGDFYANVSVDCLSIAFAILVIDRLNERRAEQELKAQLIREMGSRDNGTALRASGELRGRGWLMDRSLVKANLRYADLEGAHIWQCNLQGSDLNSANFKKAAIHLSNLQEVNFMNANLQGANLNMSNLQEAILVNTNLEEAGLHKSNLRGAVLAWAKLQGVHLSEADLQGAQGLTDEQLSTAYDLHHATMPDGSRYDGRYVLYGDLDFAEYSKANYQNPEEMAAFYGVALEAYLAGQEWARQSLRREMGLDSDTGEPLPSFDAPADLAPLPLTDESDYLRIDTPAPPAPRRNGHKASMVTHRVRR